MTGVGGRPEVVIEGSNRPDGGWKEYDFLYKPGNISTKLPVVGEFHCVMYTNMSTKNGYA